MPLLVGSRRALVSGPGIRTLVVDSFVDADATALTSHTADTGQAWTKNATGSTNTAAPTIDGGRAHGENAATISIYTVVTPVSPDCTVACDVVMRSDNNLSTCGPFGRLVAGAVTYYHVRYNTLGNVWQLFKWVANSATQLGTDQAQTLTVDQAYRAELRMLGSTISMVVDGVLLVSVTDTAIPAAGLAGLKFSGAATSTVGVHLDNLRITMP